MARAQRKRLRTKVRPPPAFVAHAQNEASIAAVQINIDNAALNTEAWSEVTALGPDAQRQHVHYTHVRTAKATDRQPSSFTRAGFYKHMECVYEEAYPEGANHTAPFFFTSNSPLFVVRPDLVAMNRLNIDMAERFCTRIWTAPLPAAERKISFPSCSRCCATFYLTHR